MAGKTIKGITIEIDGKTTKLSAALKEVESPARGLQTSLNNVNKALKLDPSNTELVSEKQKILASYVDVTREKLEKMESVQDQIRLQYANGDIDQGAYVEFQKELEYTKSKLEKLEKQQQEFGDTSKKALEEATKKCKDLEKNLKDVDAALELDPTNITLLSEKQELLADAIDATSEKLKLMKEQQDKISADYATGDIDRGAYLDFQTELSATEQKLKELKIQQQEFGGVVTQVMKEAGEKVSEFGNKVSNAGDKISGVGKSLLPVTAAITAAGAAAVNSGSDILESQNKVDVAFGDSADGVKKFADSTLDAYGIAEGTALDMAALFGDMATSMGLPQDAAAEMSIKLVGLAGDLASFKNIELDVASNALKGIFTGETESLKNLAVVMNEDNLLRFAMQQRMIDTTKSAQQLAKEELALEKAQVAYNKAVKKHGENSLEAREAALKMSDAEATLNERAKASLDTLSTAEMVQLRYAYVLNATTNAHGDFSRTSDGAANSMRVASEAVKELSADFGVLLAPYVAQVAQIISEMIKGFIALPDETKKTILVVAALVAVLGPLLIIGGKLISGVGSFISFAGKLPTMISAVTSAFSGLGGAILGIVAGILAIGGSLLWLANNWDAVKTVVSEDIDAIHAKRVATYEAEHAASVAQVSEWQATRAAAKEIQEAMVADERAASLARISETQTALAAVKTEWQSTQSAAKEIQDSMATDAHDSLATQASYVQSACATMSEIWSGFWGSVLSWGQGQLGNLKTIFTTGLSSIGSDFSAFCQKILSGITTWGSNMKTKASSAIDNVKNAISSGLERVKSLFNFEWNLPRIKLPHFNISGSFSLNPPSVPSFGVQWYAKGGILNGAQIFGAMGNTLLGGGEAGPEAVLPLSGFYSELRSILASFMGSSGDSLDLTGLYNRLDGIYDRLGRLQVVLDTGVLVGETVDQYDEALAAKQLLAERGV